MLSRQEEPASIFAAEQWEYIQSVDSVYTELLGLRQALALLVRDLAGTKVLARTDSISTYWIVANAGSRRSERLSVLARQIWLICLQHNILLSCEYVGKDVIIRKGADLMSRWQDQEDCVLKPEIFAQLWKAFGPFHVDRFSSGRNVQHNPATGQPLLFTSRFMERGSLGVDALTSSWRGLTNYAFPPPSLLDNVVGLIAQQRVDTLLICPRWTSQPWWPLLISLPHSMWLLPAGNAPFNPGPSGCPQPCGWAFRNAHLRRQPPVLRLLDFIPW